MSGAPAAGPAAGGGKAFRTNIITLSGDTDTVTIDIVADDLLADVPRWDLIKDGTACYSALENFIKTKPFISGSDFSKLNYFKTFKGKSPASSFAKSKAQSVIRENFINQLSITKVEARSYDSPFIYPASAPADWTEMIAGNPCFILWVSVR